MVTVWTSCSMLAVRDSPCWALRGVFNAVLNRVYLLSESNVVSRRFLCCFLIRPKWLQRVCLHCSSLRVTVLVCECTNLILRNTVQITLFFLLCMLIFPFCKCFEPRVERASVQLADVTFCKCTHCSVCAASGDGGWKYCKKYCEKLTVQWSFTPL